MELLVIRHAEPIRVTAEESGGRADPGLTDLGRQQARRLAAWVAADGIDHIVSSPLRRATETATPLATTTGLPVTIDEDLGEYDRSATEYIPVEEMRAANSDRWQAMVEGRWEDFGGEDPRTFRARIVPCFDRIIDAHPGERVAVVCHGGVTNVYLATVLGMDRHLWFDPAYTSISRVHAARSGARSVGSINETAHLLGSRDPR